MVVRAIGAVLFGAVVLVALYGVPVAPRQLHSTDPPEYHDALPKCMDVWSNDWCKLRKQEGQCHAVMQKCMGTCGGCCLDDAGRAACDKMHTEDELCHIQATGGYNELHTTDCLETCGACKQLLPVQCSFEKSEEGTDIAGTAHDDATCLLDRWTPSGDAKKFTITNFGDKKWTGPRLAYDRERFALLDSDGRSAGDEAWLTTPWGSVEENHIVTFEYSMYTRDFPDAMGSLVVEALVSHSGFGYRPIWTKTKAHSAMEWYTALVEVGAEAAGSPLRLRFRAITGAQDLSDIALDNIQLLERVCGDGKRTYEECDDGNLVDGDGCSSTCKVEAGYACFYGLPDQCTALTCGDGRISGTETCDDGNTADGDGCSSECQVEAHFWCDHAPKEALDHTKPELGQYITFEGPSVCEPVYEGKPRLVGAKHPLTSAPYEKAETIGCDKCGPGGTLPGTAIYEDGLLEVFSYALSEKAGGEYKAVCPSSDAESSALATTACAEMGYSEGSICEHIAGGEVYYGKTCAEWGADGANDGTVCSGGIIQSCKGHLPGSDGSTCEPGGFKDGDKYISAKAMAEVMYECSLACEECPGDQAEQCECQATWTHNNQAYAGCAETPDYPGVEWCFVAGGAGCVSAEDPTSDRAAEWRTCSTTPRDEWSTLSLECPAGAKTIAKDAQSSCTQKARTACGEALFVSCTYPTTCGDGRRYSPAPGVLENFIEKQNNDGDDMAIEGHAIGTIPAVATAEDCAGHCRSNAECKSFAFRAAATNVAGICTLHYVASADVPTSFKKSADLGLPGVELYEKRTDMLCDDGNTVDGDGCSSTCTVEHAWYCTGGNWTTPDRCVPLRCGDGQRVAEELCDDGNDISGDGCSSGCQIEDGYHCDGPYEGLSVCTKIGTLKLLDQPTLATVTDMSVPIVGSGPLLVMSAHGWGTVCLDGFDIPTATVACQDLANTWLGGRSWYVQSPGFRESKAADYAGTEVYSPRLSTSCAGTEAGLYSCSGAGAQLARTKALHCYKKVHLTCSTDP